VRFELGRIHTLLQFSKPVGIEPLFHQRRRTALESLANLEHYETNCKRRKAYTQSSRSAPRHQASQQYDPHSNKLSCLSVLYSGKDFTWKVADFGITSEVASAKGRPTTSSKGTTGYRAPELLAFPTAVYTNKVDIWSLGCILYELAVGKRLFYDDGQVLDLKYSGKEVSIPLDESFSEHCKDSITKSFVCMLKVEPVSRPSAEYLFEEFSRNYQFPQVPAVESVGDSHNVETKSLTDDVSSKLKIAEKPKEDKTVYEHPNVPVSRPTESDHLASDVRETPNHESTLTSASSTPLRSRKRQKQLSPLSPLPSHHQSRTSTTSKKVTSMKVRSGGRKKVSKPATIHMKSMKILKVLQSRRRMRRASGPPQ
jgi:serine/threonine protein kinase